MPNPNPRPTSPKEASEMSKRRLAQNFAEPPPIDEQPADDEFVDTDGPIEMGSYG